MAEPLPDIGEASFPDVPPTQPGAPRIRPEGVGVEDERAPAPHTTYPYNAIASLVITAADDSRWHGTGWFISPRTLVTAGHCVWIDSTLPQRKGFVKSIEVIPGRSGDTKPYDSAVATRFDAAEEWRTSANVNHDYGAILLDTPLGDAIGAFFGLGVFTDDDLLRVTANISGYPTDKLTGTQWVHSRKVLTVNPNKVFYAVDTTGGQSGAPVWRIMERRRRVAFAIHAYGGNTTNSGTRITPEAHARLTAWKV